MVKTKDKNFKKNKKSTLLQDIKNAKALPDESQLLSSVGVVDDSTMSTSNIYTTVGSGNDGQFPFNKIIALQGQTRTGQFDCWSDPKNWVLTTEYKNTTGLASPLYDGYKVSVLWDLFTNRDLYVATSVAPTLNVDSTGAKPVRLLQGFTVNNSDMNNDIVKVDTNYIHYGALTTFTYNETGDCWLVDQTKAGASGELVYTIYDYGYWGGYIETRGGIAEIDATLYPKLASIWGTSIPATWNASMVGYHGDKSPFKVVTKGQVETPTISNSGETFFSIRREGTPFDNPAGSFGGGFTVDTGGGVDDYVLYYSDASTRPTTKVTLNLDLSLTGITTGDETLTRRLGMRCFYVY